MTAGETATVTGTVTMSDGSTNNNCSLTLAPAGTSVATLTAGSNCSGTIKANSDGTVTVVATANATANQRNPVEGELAITVSSSITSVSVAASPASGPSGTTFNFTATVKGTGSYNSAVTWSGPAGLTSTGTDTASWVSAGTGTFTITATSKQESSQSGSVQITVTRAAPVITSFLLIGKDNWLWCVNGCNKATIGFQIQCTGCQVGDQLNFHGYWPTVSLTSSNFVSSNTIGVEEVINAANQPSGNWIYADVDPADGTPASNTLAIAYLNAANSGTLGPNGEVIQKSYATYLWQFANGAWSLANKLTLGGGASTVYDTDGTNQYLVDGNATYTMNGTLVGGANVPSDAISGNDASGNVACMVQPVYDHVSIFNPGILGQQPYLGQTGTTPYDCKVATINGTPYVFAISVGSSSSLWKFDATGNSVGSQSLTGITSLSDIQAANHVQGNWQIAAIKTGTKQGFLAVLSTYDDVLDIYDGTQNSMPLVKEVSLAPSCILPQAVTAIDATDQFRVACLVNDGLNSHTSFVGVDLSGNVTALAATSTKFPQGFVADQNSLYVLYGSGAPDSPANK